MLQQSAQYKYKKNISGLAVATVHQILMLLRRNTNEMVMLDIHVQHSNAEGCFK